MSPWTTAGQRSAADVIEPRSLVDHGLFDQVTTRIARTHNITHEHAGRIMEQALAFLYACAHNPVTALTPSPEVDLGWHTFILDTHAYSQFCQRIAGRFLHHNPEEPGGDKAAFVARLGDTIQAMRALGLTVDSELWLASAECSQCYAGCVDDPSPEGRQP
ncbi:glycine-rich domain-containing protein [Nonomuraea sp. 3N208]|uniref:glycine-rich domain-containing protein n=1 Tax=Nonomuraea sp. 3N208 TaxID=3457421 RepID=UPI003FD301BD